jgi:hypothetical protein
MAETNEPPPLFGPDDDETPANEDDDDLFVSASQVRTHRATAVTYVNSWKLKMTVPFKLFGKWLANIGRSVCNSSVCIAARSFELSQI